MKIYLAGPDIFRPDVEAWATACRALCRRYGFEALLPIDHGETLPERIFQANLDICLLYTSPSPRDGLLSRMPSSA